MEQFTYPIYKQFQNRYSQDWHVVEFTDLTKGTVIKSKRQTRPVGYKSTDWIRHTNERIWSDYDYTPINLYF